ncbi:PLP-dependent aspartate aminotransferase family protein [Pelagibacteraceae bacterium]|jgi:cystathionine beta-lyase|nr:PLP-dependent aspartate aminotransferase family protein [Pelagibacteraceae bacterium]MDB9743316.1 PLP-dependent aspartate aminotransferase family protein [Pelagibacteraceae bacterium]|tara:strand:- start:134 stop:1324 length:1191 start_codon:yes stop_codon:yes gene_type:complete
MKKSISTFLKHPTKDNSNRSANPPVTRASTILFNSMQELHQHEKKIAANKKISYYSYGRYGSSTTIELENIIKGLEQAHHVFLTGTGFGGVALALMSVCRPGDEILVSDNVYGPTKEISEDLLKEFKINAIFYDPENFKDLENKVTKKTRIIVVENPGSITFEFQDLSKIVNLAKRKNILTFLDNTWGTPLYLQPLKIGFDMSFTSATKYFSGHSDAMGGSLAVNKKVFKKVMFFYKLSGYRMAADEAYLIIRGLRTLDVRLKQHYENTKTIIKFLKKQKKIKEILYPHDPSSKNYKLWKKYYSGANGLFSIVIKSKKKSSVIKFINSLELFGIGYSWGGFESLVILQELRGVSKYTKKRRYFRFDKDEHIVRLHIGLEDPKDLIEDLKKSLKYIK